MNNFLDAALRNEKQIIADRRHIHKNPEVGFYLPDTADYVRQRLADMVVDESALKLGAAIYASCSAESVSYTHLTLPTIA